MKKELFNKYNALKEEFIKSIDEVVKDMGGTIQTSIEYDKLVGDTTGTELITITIISRDDNDIICHLYVTDNVTLEVYDYWTPLRDLSFDELFKIVEQL